MQKVINNTNQDLYLDILKDNSIAGYVSPFLKHVKVSEIENCSKDQNRFFNISFKWPLLRIFSESLDPGKDYSQQHDIKVELSEHVRVLDPDKTFTEKDIKQLISFTILIKANHFILIM